MTYHHNCLQVFPLVPIFDGFSQRRILIVLLHLPVRPLFPHCGHDQVKKWPVIGSFLLLTVPEVQPLVLSLSQ